MVFASSSTKPNLGEAEKSRILSVSPQSPLALMGCSRINPFSSMISPSISYSNAGSWVKIVQLLAQGSRGVVLTFRTSK
jgi:hypothetical protein